MPARNAYENAFFAVPTSVTVAKPFVRIPSPATNPSPRTYTVAFECALPSYVQLPPGVTNRIFRRAIANSPVTEPE